MFHLVGGGALGVALLPLRARFGGEGQLKVSIPLLIWALAFGGFPLLMALVVPELLPIQLLELVIAFAATFFFWDQMRELLGQDNVLLVLVGGVFFLVGIGACAVLLSNGAAGKGLLIGILSGGAGLGLIALGLARLLKVPRDPQDPEDE